MSREPGPGVPFHHEELSELFVPGPCKPNKTRKSSFQKSPTHRVSWAAQGTRDFSSGSTHQGVLLTAGGRDSARLRHAQRRAVKILILVPVVEVVDSATVELQIHDTWSIFSTVDQFCCLGLQTRNPVREQTSRTLKLAANAVF